MTGSPDTVRAAAIEYELKAAGWLARANDASERGEREKAETYYGYADRWLTKMNAALGNG